MKQFIPERRKGAGAPTSKDVSNLFLVGAFSVLTIWLTCDLLALPVSKEVAGAFGTILGYFVARHFRY